LEVSEVKENFDAHHLLVNEKAIIKLFKSAAINRQKGDPCNDLSLYEFSVFSKKAAGDFQKLMKDIKTNMLQMMEEKGITTIDMGLDNEGVQSILPKRKKAYIKYLPSSFNPLMNHFKDEEKRNDIRNSLTNTLDEIIKIGTSKKSLRTILKNNQHRMRCLLESHFSKEEADKESRRLLTQRKEKTLSFCSNKCYPLSNRLNSENQTQEPELSSTEIERIRAKTKQDLKRLVETARNSVLKETVHRGKWKANLAECYGLTNKGPQSQLSNYKRILSKASTNTKWCEINKKATIKGGVRLQRSIQKLLGSNLLLRVRSTDSNFNKQPLTNTYYNMNTERKGYNKPLNNVLDNTTTGKTSPNSLKTPSTDSHIKVIKLKRRF